MEADRARPLDESVEYVESENGLHNSVTALIEPLLGAGDIVQNEMDKDLIAESLHSH